MRTCPILAATLLAASLAAQNPCPPRGLTLTATGGRLGDAWSVEVQGTPLVPGLFGFDTAGGPSTTPFGTICVGMTPALVVLPMQLDASGHFALNGLMPVLPALIGTRFHLAAGAIDSSQPSGYALSNSAELAPRHPRLFFVAPGTSTPFGTTPGSVTAVDVINGGVGFSVPLPSSGRMATFVRERNWLMVAAGNGLLLGYDGDTGAQVFSTQMPAVTGSVIAMEPAPGGATVLLLNGGMAPNPFSTGSPGGLVAVSLDTGLVTANVTLPTGRPDALLTMPGTAVALLRLRDSVVPVDHVQGTAWAPIPMPPGHGDLVDWRFDAGLFYCLQAGNAALNQAPALNVVLPFVPYVLAVAPLSLPAPASLLRTGPGSAGPAAYVYSASGGVLHEYDLTALTFTASIATGPDIVTYELSALRTQWLLLCQGGACGNGALRTIAAGTTNLSAPVNAPAGVAPSIAISPSLSIGRAALHLSGAATVLLTDPLQVGPTAALPASSLNYLVLSN